MRTFYFITTILINSIIFPQEGKIIGTPIPLNEIGIRLEIKNFFIDGHRFKIQETKPYYKTIQLNKKLAKELSLRGTPASIINNTMIPGYIKEQKIIELLDGAKTAS